MYSTKDYLLLFAKGLGMGAANVIPGVSGGTIAFVTGIYEKLIDSINAFNLDALKLLLKFDIRGFAKHVNLDFLLAVFSGVAISILSLAKVLKFLFQAYPEPTWSFFFGLILATVFLVGKDIKPINISSILFGIMGIAAVVGVFLLHHGSENDNFLWLFICGVVAICSMILPGLSGSFVLLVMGNYALILGAASDLNFKILFPVMLGAGIGLPAFSHLLSYIFKHFRNQAISLITGLIIGSLYIIWPWKDAITENVGGKEKVIQYIHHLPVNFDSIFFVSIGMMIVGIGLVVLLELLGTNKPQKA